VALVDEAARTEAERDTLRIDLQTADDQLRALRVEAKLQHQAGSVHLARAEKAEAALLDAQHQEAQDIEALSRLEDERDAKETECWAGAEEVKRLEGLILEYEVNSPGCQSNLLTEAHRILARRSEP